MLPILKFYGNHTIVFKNQNIYDLELYAISELRKIPIPELVLQTVFDSLRLQFPDGNLSVFTDMKNWCPFSFQDIPGVRDFPKVHLSSMGPMGMHIAFTPHHIALPQIIYERIDWYSPINKEKIHAIRSYYYSIINHFGGDHALYVDERIIDKFAFPLDTSEGSALETFEQSLITQYGKSNKSLYAYAHGKYPKYYIDSFEDIQSEKASLWKCPNCGRTFKKKNQRHSCSIKPKTFDEYIEQVPAKYRDILQRVRETIRSSAPECEEKIALFMPAFFLKENLIYLAVFQNYLGLYPGEDGVREFLARLFDEGYKFTTGAIQLPWSRPIPYDLIADITKYRVLQAKKKGSL